MKAAVGALFLTAAGVSAHPSRIHGHQHLHRDLVGRDFVMANKPLPALETTTIYAAPSSTSVYEAPPPPPATSSAAPPPPPPAAPAKPSPSQDDSSNDDEDKSSSSSSAAYVQFCGGNKKRATAAEIAYAGNTGGGTGCNMMTVSDKIAHMYDYSATFVNNEPNDVTCDCWNKIGPDGGINGFFKGNQAVTFDVPQGGSKVLVAEANSQGGCCCASGGCPTTNFGQFAGTWVEFDMGNESNNKWSGADASCLVSASQGMSIPALEVCSGSDCSKINAGGTGTNAYLAGMEAADGVGLNLPAGNVRLTVTVG